MPEGLRSSLSAGIDQQVQAVNRNVRGIESMIMSLEKLSPKSQELLARESFATDHQACMTEFAEIGGEYEQDTFK